MDVAKLFRYLFTLHSLTIYPLFPPVTLLLNSIYFVRHRLGLRGSAIEIDSKKGSASQKVWELLL